MNRLERRRQAWLARHQSDIGTHTNPIPRPEYAEKVVQKFLSDLKTKKIAHVAGIYGPETEGSDGYLEEVIKPEEGGTFLKIYGCSYLYKGNASNNVVYILQFPKHILSHFLREVVGGSVLYLSALALRFLFQRKKLISDLESFFWEVEWKVVRHCNISEKEYNILQKEIECAANFAAKGTIWEKVVSYAVKFIKLVFFVDNAYRFRFQDVFGTAQHGKGIEEFYRILDLLISRERVYVSSEGGMTLNIVERKWRFIKKVLQVALFLSPSLKKVIVGFIDNLDIEKVRMDEADEYFSLRFKSYDFKGIPYEEREKEWNRINKERQHVFLI